MTPIIPYRKEKPLTSLVSMGGGAAGMANAGDKTVDPVYVDDVFSTYLWHGSNTTRPVNNGIKLGNAGAGSGVEFDRTANPAHKDYLHTTTHPSSDFTMGTGDFTVECWVYIHDISIISGFWQISSTSGGLTSSNYGNTLAAAWDNNEGWMIYGAGQYSVSATPTPSNNTWYHVAYVRSSGTSKLYINGTSVISQADTNNYDGTYIVIGGYYSEGYLMDGVISNFRVVKGQALYTSNFTPSTESLTTKSQGATPSNVKLLCCNSSSPTAATVRPSQAPLWSMGNPFASIGPFTASDGAGGMVIIKQRNSANPWFVTDSERGATKTLRLAQGSSGQSTDASALMSFNNNGFTVGNDGATNGTSGQHYMSHTFRKAKGFFDVVKYTGTGSPQNISHNLGSAPGAMIVRRYDGAEDWDMLHVKGGGNAYYYQINQSTAQRQGDGSNALWGGQDPTATHFTVGSHGRTNQSGWEYVAYLFADDEQIFGEDQDQSVIKCGTYTTDGSGNATVNLGWEPQWVMVKRYDGTSNWSIWDTMRGWFNFTNYDSIKWNSDAAETGNSNYGSPYGRGFHNNGNIGANANGIYIAIRRPDGLVGKPIVSSSQVFGMNVGNASSTIPSYDNPDFAVEYGLEKRSNDTHNWWSSSRITGGSYSYPNITNTQNVSGDYAWDSNAGYIEGSWANTDTQAWMWRRYAGMDVQAYTGSGSADFVYHGLGKIPEMIWVKCRNNGSDWRVYHKDLGTSNDPQDYSMILNSHGTQLDDATVWNDAMPEVNRFTIGTHADVNQANKIYVAMLFASIEGISSVGTYTGSNSDVTINCGFAPRFILVKAIDAGRHWRVLGGRGSTAIPLSGSGNESDWILNENYTRNNNNNYVNTTATGFVMRGGIEGDTNWPGWNFIYYAHA